VWAVSEAFEKTLDGANVVIALKDEAYAAFDEALKNRKPGDLDTVLRAYDRLRALAALYSRCDSEDDMARVRKLGVALHTQLMSRSERWSRFMCAVLAGGERTAASAALDADAAMYEFDRRFPRKEEP
jgi:hypothetical protein